MRNRIVTTVFLAALTGATATGCTGCGTWWQDFKNNPVAQVQTFEQTVQIAVSDAQLAWSAVQPFLPAAQAAAINAQFTKALADVNHALAVLNDAVQAAVAAQQPSPDFSTLMAAVSDAVGQILAIIAQYTTSSDGGAPVPQPPVPVVTDAGASIKLSSPSYPAASSLPGFQDLQSQHALLKKMAVQH